MTKEQFITQLIKLLYPIFPKEEYKIRAEHFTKNNDTTYYGITIRQKNETMYPTIYVDDFYRDFIRKKITLTEIVDRIQQVIVGFTRQGERYQKFSIDWSDCKSKVTYRIISKERNKNFLTKLPHIPFLNLSIVFYLIHDISERGLETICITEDLRLQWGVTTKELMQQAEENTPRLFEPTVETMENALYKYIGSDTIFKNEEIPPIYIFSNHMRINGATVLIYKDFLQNFAEEKQSNLYILPSSIHEVLVIPDCNICPFSLSFLNKMVQDVNCHHVPDEEILSDCAYYYDYKEKRFLT